MGITEYKKGYSQTFTLKLSELQKLTIESESLVSLCELNKQPVPAPNIRTQGECFSLAIYLPHSAMLQKVWQTNSVNNVNIAHSRTDGGKLLS